jgi:hypothetical protein
MAVRIECAAIVLQCRGLDRRLPEGSEGLIAEIEDWPWPIYIDDDLVAVTVDDIRENDCLLEELGEWGVVEPFCGTWRHAAIVDEEWGPTYEVDWLDFVKTKSGSWVWMPSTRY